jgi:hypothetical protein
MKVSESTYQVQENKMLTYYYAEQRNGRIKFSTDVDCLAADVIRCSKQVFPDRRAVLEQAQMLALRGFQVCVDDETGYDEVRPYRVNGKVEG